LKTLHGHIVRQILGNLAMSSLVLTFVFILGTVVKEIMGLLLNQHASLWLVIKAVALLVPFVLAFVFPMAMLTSCLLVFGRLSADHELTAMRANGVSLMSLASPVLLLSLVFSVACAWVNMDLAPRSRVAYKRLLYQIGVERTSSILQENQYQEISPNIILYAARTRGTKLDGLRLEQVYVSIVAPETAPGAAKTSSSLPGWSRAPEGWVEVQGKNVTLILTNAYGAVRDGEQWNPTPSQNSVEFPIDLKQLNAEEPKPDLSDMTFSQLMKEKKELEERKVEDITHVLVQLHREAAFSFACIGFTLIGIPLGIRAHRRETSAGAAMALALLVVYYSFIILSQSLSSRPEFGPHLIVWAPNFIFQVVGGALLWKANRGG
jgi:lipopolysaccharide export system permease protein